MITSKTSLLAAALVASALSAQAGIVLSSSVPTINDYDVAQLSTGAVGNAGGNYYLGNNPAPGSTFTTTFGGSLDAISFYIEDNGNVNSFAVPNVRIRIGTVDGSDNFTEIYSETLGWDGVSAVGSNKWMTMNLTTPVVLSGATTYAFGVENLGDGYVGFGAVSGDPLAGARTAYVSSGNVVSYGNLGADAAFHANIIPEPSTYAAIAGALVLGLVAYRRRRA